MNFLEIAKEVNIASGLQGDVDTITSPTGIQRSLIHLINSAYLDIQMLRQDWAWMRTNGVFSWNFESNDPKVNSGIHKYLLIHYNHKPLEFIDYEEWLLNSYTYKTGIPEKFTLLPETNGIIINPADAYYNVEYRGIKVPESLTSNVQVPLLPVFYHNIIVYKSAYEIGLFLGNAEIMNINLGKYDFLLGSLMRSQNLPKRIIQRPLA